MLGFRIKHELNADELIDKVKGALSSSSKEETTEDKAGEKEEFGEFRFRIRTKHGTDINIPESFVGTAFVVTCAVIVFNFTLKVLNVNIKND